MDRPAEPTANDRRLRLIVVALIAVLVSLGFVFIWPW
jgi:hypothetical protein